MIISYLQCIYIYILDPLTYIYTFVYIHTCASFRGYCELLQVEIEFSNIVLNNLQQCFTLKYSW